MRRFWGTGGAIVFAVGLLLTGIHLGFAVAPLASVWPWAAGVWVVAALTGWGWRVKIMAPLLVLGFGFVSAARVEDLRQSSLEEHWRSGSGGRAPVVDLSVDGEVVVRPQRRGGEAACFPSHLGPAPLWVMLPMSEAGRCPKVGEVVRCTGWVSRKALHESRFARRFFWGQKMIGVADASARARLLSALTAACARRAALGLAWCSELVALNRAILLGQRAGLTTRQRQAFVTAGTIHVFAISGLHVMLVALMLVRALGVVGLSMPLRGVFALPVLALYVFMTGARPSAVRAAMMVGFYLAAPAFGRRGDSLVAWALTALAVYGLAPERVFDAGCTFSFMVMLGLVVWMKGVLPHLPERLQQGIGGMLGISLAAWIAGVPVAAHLFGRIALAGLVANLVVVNLAALTVAFGLMGMVLGFVVPPLAVVFNNLAAMSTGVMRWVSMAVAAVPGASLTVDTWPVALCLAWYLSWALAGFVILRLRGWKKGVWWK